MFRVGELLFINQTILLTLQKRGARTAVDNLDIVNTLNIIKSLTADLSGNQSSDVRRDYFLACIIYNILYIHGSTIPKRRTPLYTCEVYYTQL